MNQPDPLLKSLVVSEDPAKLAQIGDALHFKSITPRFDPAQPPFTRPSNWEAFEGAVLAVMFSTRAQRTRWSVQRSWLRPV
jgi:hypothetical protein